MAVSRRTRLLHLATVAVVVGFASVADAAPNTLARAMQLWRDSYQVDAAVPVGWTSTGGATGNASEAFRNTTLSRINYYRSMAGLASVTRDASFDHLAQEAATMMSAAGKLSHTPTNDGSWPYFSADGASGAAHSSLSLFSTGPAAVDNFIDDESGFGLGHRRLIFNPTRTRTGIGIAAASGFASSLAEYNDDFNGARPSEATTPYFAWPSAGYVPYGVTNNIWSVSINHYNGETDVTGAAVVVTKGGVVQTIGKAPDEANFGQAEWYADPTVAFTLNTVTPAAPTTYTVKVSNVKVNNVTQSPYQYDVTLFDPSKYKLAPGLRVSQDANVASADLNHDGAVNFDDLIILAQGYNHAYNFDDLAKLAQNYNSTYPILIAGALTAPPLNAAEVSLSDAFLADFARASLVPEPTTLTAAGVLIGVMARRVRRL